MHYKLEFVPCNAGFILYNYILCCIVLQSCHKAGTKQPSAEYLARVEQMYLISAVSSLAQIQQYLIFTLFREQCELLSSCQLFISVIV